jgi:hypothetical protein
MPYLAWAARYSPVGSEARGLAMLGDRRVARKPRATYRTDTAVYATRLQQYERYVSAHRLRRDSGGTGTEQSQWVAEARREARPGRGERLCRGNGRPRARPTEARDELQLRSHARAPGSRRARVGPQRRANRESLAHWFLKHMDIQAKPPLIRATKMDAETCRLVWSKQRAGESPGEHFLPTSGIGTLLRFGAKFILLMSN